MRRLIAVVVLWCGALAAAPPAQPGFWDRFRAVVEGHLGRSHAWGASGLKSFDCSGFVWRVMYENGILMKRTTARKLCFLLPAVSKPEQWSFGNIVFFDNLAHCGIVNSRSDFFHAESSKGTNLSRFDPYWRSKVCGVRRLAQ